MKRYCDFEVTLAVISDQRAFEIAKAAIVSQMDSDPDIAGYERIGEPEFREIKLLPRRVMLWRVTAEYAESKRLDGGEERHGSQEKQQGN